jgi:hypothetical protein
MMFTKVEDIKNTHSRGAGFEEDIFLKKNVVPVSEFERQIITSKRIGDSGGSDEMFQGRKRKENASAESTNKRERMTNIE